MSSVIKVENLSKEYRLGAIGHGMLFKDLQSGWAKLRGKEDPNAKVFASEKAPVGKFLALNNISFEVKPGEVLGVIGRNGAGKSTLLKILSRVTSPTRGSICLRGRVASLLEVGTGFHPELTGRENIFLNGAILGMTRRDIAGKLDEIIEFSGVAAHIDTPVKRYSSGMYVRLAFAVSAHLEPDILVVDEVLAVGDAEFQKKCLGKMKDVSTESGRTILFVSHSLDAIRRICTKGLLLEAGQIIAHGNAGSVINTYKQRIRTRENYGDAAKSDRLNRTNGSVQLEKVSAFSGNGRKTWSFRHGENVLLRVDWKAKMPAEGLGIYVAIISPDTGNIVTNFKEVVQNKRIVSGASGTIEVLIKSINLRAKYYRLYIAIADKAFRNYFDVLDENVGLPDLEILPYSKDPHLAFGYFDLDSKIMAIKRK